MQVQKQVTANKLVQVILTNYNIEKPLSFSLDTFPQGYMNTVIPLTFVYPTHREKYVAILYNAQRYNSPALKMQLEEQYRVASQLSEKGFPTRFPLVSKENEHLINYEFLPAQSNYFGLYNYLPGDTIPWESYTRRHIFAIGELLAEMHSTLEDAGNAYPHLKIWHEYLTLDSQKLITYFKKNTEVISRKLHFELDTAKLQEIIAIIDNSEKHQIIHMDLVRGNLLFSNEKEAERYKITGILDFEKVIKGPVQLDLARTLSFLLVDCKYKSESEIITQFLERGYGVKNLKNFFANTNLKYYLLYFWTRDLWKFLSSNPYESLVDNYHYQATAKYLSKYKVLL